MQGGGHVHLEEDPEPPMHTARSRQSGLSALEVSMAASISGAHPGGLGRRHLCSHILGLMVRDITEVFLRPQEMFVPTDAQEFDVIDMAPLESQSVELRSGKRSKTQGTHRE